MALRMKSHVWPVLSALVFVSLLLLIVFRARVPELRYEDKTIDDWIFESFAAYPKRNPEAIEALYAMGEPALSRLVEMVETEDSRIAKKLLEHSGRVPAIHSVVTSRYWYRYLAAMVLGGLGTNATVAIPALKKMAKDPDSNLARVASAALVLVQNEPVADYITLSLDHENTNSSRAYGIILSLGTHAKVGIPLYTNELNSTNSSARLRAMVVLQYMCAESPECVPMFTNLLSDDNRLVRVQAINGLANCGDMAKHTAPLILQQLNSPDRSCRSSAVLFFRNVIPADEFTPFASAMSRATNDVDEVVRGLALKTLAEKSATR